MPRSNTPPGRLDMAAAEELTGYERHAIARAATAGHITGAFQRTPNTPWHFTETGLRQWIGIEEDVA